MTNMMSIDDAIRTLRRDPQYASLVHYAYFDEDPRQAADRFMASAEFAEVLSLLGTRVTGAVVVDIGAGTGIASAAFVRNGASRVFAVEPDASELVGRGVMTRAFGDLPIVPVDAFGDAVPLPDACADIVYGRQVLHHVKDLPATFSEMRRLLKPGGFMLFCREHVVDDAAQMAEFLRNHIMHQMTGTENAYPLESYTSAITGAGFDLKQVIGPWDSVINAYPEVQTRDGLKTYASDWLQRRYGKLGRLVSYLPGVRSMVSKRARSPKPGRMVSFVATKPAP